MRKTLYTIVVSSFLCLALFSALAFATVPNVNTDVGTVNIAAGNTTVQLAPATWHTYTILQNLTASAPNDVGRAIIKANYEGQSSIACGNLDDASYVINVHSKTDGAGYATNTSWMTNVAAQLVDRSWFNTATNNRLTLLPSTVNDAEIAPVYTYAMELGRTSYGRANLHLRV